MSEPREDRELNEYLDGRSPLSARYRAVSGEEPSSAVDNAILAASRRAAGSRPVGTLIPRRWVKPLSLAAIVVLSATVVITMQRDSDVMMLERDAAVQGSAPMQQMEAPKTAPAPEMSRHAEAYMDAPASGAEDTASGPPIVEPSAIRAPAREELAKPPAEESAAAANRPRAAERGVRPPPEMMKEEAPAAMRRTPSAMILRAPSPVPDQPDRLAAIVRLWEAGHRERASEELRVLLFEHPDYPDDELQRMLPPELYAEARRFLEE